jgi:hypothetical protein
MKYTVTAGWDDVPHLSAETKAELFASIPPHHRDARSKGIPVLGRGAIYPVAETAIVCDGRGGIQPCASPPRVHSR